MRNDQRENEYNNYPFFCMILICLGLTLLLSDFDRIA